MKRASIIVAIVVIVTALGLFVGLVKSVRDAAAQTQCHNNLKQIALATQSYHDANKRYPRAIASVPTEELPPERQVSWYFDVIGYMIAIMNPDWVIDRKKPYDAPENRFVTEHNLGYLCPAGPTRSPGAHLTSYVGTTGVGKDAAWLPLDDARAGVFGYTRKVWEKDLKAGSSNVLLVMETATDNGHWAIGGHGTARGLDTNGAFYLGGNGQFNSGHGGYLSAFITQAAMADGSVRTFTDDTADHVLESLATLSGNQ